MSIDVALDNIHLRSCARWGHTEYSLRYHGDYLAARTGLPADDPNLVNEAQNRLSIDFCFRTNNGIICWQDAGRTTDMGHATYAADGGDQRKPGESPFKTEQDVWDFDAVKEYGLPDFDEQVRAYQEYFDNGSAVNTQQLLTGGYYNTIISGAIAAFGWNMLLLAAADPVRMEKVFDSFFQRTLFHMKAWAATTADVIIQHDDFVWPAGPFMHPDIYRKVLIPRYAELWKPLHEAGKKVLFCSDGDFSLFVDDVAKAGADGFIFEPCVDFGMMAERFGSSHCLIGSFVDCRDLTFRRWEKVSNDIDRTFRALASCKGAIFAVGNHLPPNIPTDMLDRFFDALLPRLTRRA